MKHLQSNRTEQAIFTMPKYRKPTSIMTNLQFTSNKLVHSNLINNLRQAQGKFGLLVIKNIFDNKVLMNFAKFS